MKITKLAHAILISSRKIANGTEHCQAQHIDGSRAQETRTNSLYFHQFSYRVVETFYLNCKENELYVDNKRQMEEKKKKTSILLRKNVRQMKQ